MQMNPDLQPKIEYLWNNQSELFEQSYQSLMYGLEEAAAHGITTTHRTHTATRTLTTTTMSSTVRCSRLLAGVARLPMTAAARVCVDVNLTA